MLRPFAYLLMIVAAAAQAFAGVAPTLNAFQMGCACTQVQQQDDGCCCAKTADSTAEKSCCDRTESLCCTNAEEQQDHVCKCGCKFPEPSSAPGETRTVGRYFESLAEPVAKLEAPFVANVKSSSQVEETSGFRVCGEVHPLLCLWLL